MILSLALIIAVIMGVTPWVLLALCITWLPDFLITVVLAAAFTDSMDLL